MPSLSRSTSDFTDPERGPIFSPRFGVALLLVVVGIAWIAYYYIVVRVDPTAVPAPEPGNPAFMADLEKWNYAIGFGLMYLLLAGRHMELLLRSPWFLWFALGTSLAWLAVAIPYWFRIPITGLAIASACFALALVLLPA